MKFIPLIGLIGLGSFCAGCSSETISDAIYPVSSLEYPEVDENEWAWVSKGNEYVSWGFHKGQSGRPVIIFLHGNSVSAKETTRDVGWLLDAGYSVLVLEYPGYEEGNSSTPNEAQIVQAIEDAVGAVKGKYPHLRVYIVGHSLGGAFGVIASSKLDVDGLVSQSAFTKTSDFAPALPVEYLAGNQIDAKSHAQDVHMPWVLLHCNNDPDVPAWMQRRLLDEAQAGQGEVLDQIQNCDHHSLLSEEIVDSLRWLETQS